MKKTKFTEHQIIKAIKENEQGRSVEEISRELGINRVTFYGWRKKYSDIEVSRMKLLKELEDENWKPKQMYVELSHDNVLLKDVLSKKW